MPEIKCDNTYCCYNVAGPSLVGRRCESKVVSVANSAECQTYWLSVGTGASKKIDIRDSHLTPFLK